jgi:hypothetical protein
MDGRHDKIQVGQQFVLEIQRATGQDVDLGPGQQRDSLQPRADLVDLFDLLCEPLGPGCSPVN